MTESGSTLVQKENDLLCVKLETMNICKLLDVVE